MCGVEQIEQEEELFCLDPEAGTHRLPDYLAETLPEKQKEEFEYHLSFCLKCQKELECLRWVVQQIALREQQAVTESEPFFRQYHNHPLPVTSVVDGASQNLSANYFGKPLRRKLAASSQTSGEIDFPITVEYAGGKLTGQFWKRVGHLFYRLKNSTVGRATYRCTLVYASPSAPSQKKMFEFHEGQERRLGAYHEFVTSDTLQELLEAIKHFQLSIDT